MARRRYTTFKNRARVLTVCAARERRDAVVARLDALGVRTLSACDIHTARAMLNESFYDVVVVGDADGESPSIVEALCAADRSVSCVVLAPEATLDLAVAAMRAGAVDLRPDSCTDEALIESLISAAARSRRLLVRERLAERRARKLRRASRELARSRDVVTAQLETLCGDAAPDNYDLSEHVRQLALASELNAMFRQELDLECLLRTALGYILKKIGSTNAAIFLPSASGDYTLGAYVNYDCPRDTAETLLDHLACIAAPALEHRDDIAVMRGLSELRTEPSPGGEWLEDSAVAAFACRPEGECLAVVVLFRDRRTPFSPAAVRTLRIIKDLFGQQLARVVRVHHRHLPNHQWGGFFGDDKGLAA
jgi:DNA-binding NarL/FixJ family response regulator